MNAEIVPLRASNVNSNRDLCERLTGLLAIFRAIHDGELLAALPECEIAREQHQTGTRLLLLAERELITILGDVASERDLRYTT